MSALDYRLPDITRLYKWFEANAVPEDHDFAHCFRVMSTVQAAILKDFKPTADEVMTVCMAAYLHDVDDPKIAKSIMAWRAEMKIVDAYTVSNSGGTREVKVPYPVASWWLKELNVNPKLHNNIRQCISLTSCSTNGNNADPTVPKWMYLVRDGDRLDALGKRGIERCHQVTMRLGNCIVCKTTPLPVDEQGLALVLAQRPLSRYASGAVKSESMIDHFYDKLLHLTTTASGSPLLQSLIDKQQAIMRAWLFNFNRTLRMIRITDCLKGTGQLVL